MCYFPSHSNSRVRKLSKICGLIRFENFVEFVRQLASNWQKKNLALLLLFKDYRDYKKDWRFHKDFEVASGLCSASHMERVSKIDARICHFCKEEFILDETQPYNKRLLDKSWPVRRLRVIAEFLKLLLTKFR